MEFCLFFGVMFRASRETGWVRPAPFDWLPRLASGADEKEISRSFRPRRGNVPAEKFLASSCLAPPQAFAAARSWALGSAFVRGSDDPGRVQCFVETIRQQADLWHDGIVGFYHRNAA